MAANCARRTVLSSSATAFLRGSSRSPSSTFSNGAKLGGFASPKPTSSPIPRHKLSFFSRLPVELGCAQSLMPLHSVTASALLTSMLSSKMGNWGWLSEGMEPRPEVGGSSSFKDVQVFKFSGEDLPQLYSRAVELLAKNCRHRHIKRSLLITV